LLLSTGPEQRSFAATVHLLDRYSIGLKRMVRLVQTAQF
jgi:hypothetical protein